MSNKVALLRLSAPMQSWGTKSHFNIRDTGREPTKSGVVGLVCSTLGICRDDPPNMGSPSLLDIAALRFGVRVDREGQLRYDFQTAGCGTFNGEKYGIVKTDGKLGAGKLSWRYYLADAVFLVGFEGPEPIIQKILAAAKTPRWFVFLGRKAFVPSESLTLRDGGLRDGPLESALRDEPWLIREQEAIQNAMVREREFEYPPAPAPKQLRFICDIKPNEPHEVKEHLRTDAPLCFAHLNRNHGPRLVKEWSESIPSETGENK